MNIAFFPEYAFSMLNICLFRDDENSKQGRISIQENKSSAQLELEEELRKRIEDLEEKNCTLLKSNEEQKKEIVELKSEVLEVQQIAEEVCKEMVKKVEDLEKERNELDEKLTELQKTYKKAQEKLDIAESFDFEKLERHNTLEPILDFLGVSDIEALSKVSSFLSNYIDRHYLLRLSLPLPPETSEKLGNRKVLALTSCCNLAGLPGIHTFQPFNQLNLTNLRELKLIGNSNLHRITSEIYYKLEVSEVYHNSLQFLLKSFSKTATLKKLEILTDSTTCSVNTAGMITGLVNLEELMLHNDDCYRWKANTIIRKTLLNKNISVLNLVGFGDGNPSKSNEPLVVHSETLTQLRVSGGEKRGMGLVARLDLVLPSLTILETELPLPSSEVDNFFDRKMVETNCPLLCTWNGVDVKDVAKKAGASNWAEHLTFPEPDFVKNNYGLGLIF